MDRWDKHFFFRFFFSRLSLFIRFTFTLFVVIFLLDRSWRLNRNDFWFWLWWLWIVFWVTKLWLYNGSVLSKYFLEAQFLFIIFKDVMTFISLREIPVLEFFVLVFWQFF